MDINPHWLLLSFQSSHSPELREGAGFLGNITCMFLTIPLHMILLPPPPPKFGYWDASTALFPVGDRPGQGSSDDTQTLTYNPLQNKQSSLSSSIFLHSINKYILSMYYVPFTAVVSWECSHDLPSHLIKRASKSPNYPFITECCYFCLINNAFTEQKTEVGEFQKTEP